MGFSTVDAIVNAITVNSKMQRITFEKLATAPTVANIPHSLWTATGNPTLGAFPAVGIANGRVTVGGPTTATATPGALHYTNAVGPATMHLISAGLTTKVASSTGTFILCDKITDIRISSVQAGGSTLTGVTATSRLAATTAPGDGGQLWIEVVSALTGTAITKTFTYTDQLGNTAHTTGSMVGTATAVVNRSVNSKLWQTLAAGDTGLRSLDTVASTSGGTAGDIGCCIVRPIATIPVPTVSLYSERDFVVEMPNIPLLYDSSCLFLIYIPTAAVTPSVFGELRICEN